MSKESSPMNAANAAERFFRLYCRHCVEVPSRAVLKFGWRDLQHEHRIGSGGEVNRLLCG